MSTRPLLAEGSRLEEDDSSLRDELRSVKRQLVAAEMELEEVRAKLRSAQMAVSNLRRTLEPLYTGLCQVFGDFDRAGVSASDNGASPAPSSSKIEVWKQQFPGKAAQIIDLLAKLGAMNTTQIATTGKMDKRTIANVICTLNKAGVIKKNGGVFSLRT